MRKLFTLVFAITIVGLIFNSCKKDDETVLDNSITIEGTFTVGDKTYTNPTFDLGASTDHKGFRYPMYVKSIEPTYMIKIEPLEDVFDLGEGMLLEYDYYIYSDAVGVKTNSEVEFGVFDPLKQVGFWLYSNNVTTTVTTVDAVGGYIEGTFEGTFYVERKVETTYPVKGKFKVKRTADEIPQQF